jgi:hypothetical protein
MKARIASVRVPVETGQAKSAKTPKSKAQEPTPTQKSDTLTEPTKDDSFERAPRRRIAPKPGPETAGGAKASSYIGAVASNLSRPFQGQANKKLVAAMGGAASLPAAFVGAPNVMASEANPQAGDVQSDSDAPVATSREFLNGNANKLEPRADVVKPDSAVVHEGLDPTLLKKSSAPSQLEAWRKTTKSNGASAATIKAAVDSYGKEGVFKKIVKSDEGAYSVTLQNGKQVKVSAGELKSATEASKFEQLAEGRDVDFANLAFSVMAKESQAINRHPNFSSALKDLNSGEWPEKCANFLGIPPNQVEKLSGDNLGKHDSIVAWGRSAVMVDSRKADKESNSSGDIRHVYDADGKPKPYDKSTHPDAMRFISHKETADNLARMNESLKDAMKRHKGISAKLIAPTEDNSEIKAWRQNGQGNCASVATIKAAVDCYGKANVFNQITKNSNGSYDVTLQNGRKVHVTQDELKTVSRHSAFSEKGKGEDAKFANFAFAVMVKENKRISGHRTLSGSINDLNDGEYPPSCATYIGIPKKSVEHLTGKSKKGKDSIVAWNSAHAVMANERKAEKRSSHHYDSYGTPYEYTGRRYPNAFRFIPFAPK